MKYPQMTEHMDGAGKIVKVGSRVKFRGKEYTIKKFIENSSGSCGTSQIKFEEEQHCEEIADEINIDIISI